MTRHWIHVQASPWFRDRNQPPPEGWALLRKIGFDTVRWVVDSSQVITAPYTYDFATRFDRDFELFAKLDYSIIVNVMWAPAHMSVGPPDESIGKPAYEEYVAGVCVYTGGPDNEWRFGDECAYTADGVRREANAWPVPNSCRGKKDDPRHDRFSGVDGDVPQPSMEHHAFLPEKPWALLPNVPHIDAAQMEHYGAAVAAQITLLCERFKVALSKILFADWNEVEGKWYWPPVQSPPYEPAYDRFVNEVWIPYMRGVRSVIPDAFFVGPDAAYPSGLNFLLEAVKRVGAEWLPNAISGHLYAAGAPFPQGTINEIERPGGWREVMLRHGYKELWNTEYGDRLGNAASPGTLVAGTRELVERFPWIVAHTPIDTDYWVEGGKEAWAAGRFVPSQTAIDMKALIAETREVKLPPPARVLTERAYRITDMKRYETRDRVYIAPTYLFVAIRQPGVIVTRGPAMNVEAPFRGDDYIIVPVMNDAREQGDQYFELLINARRWFGPSTWSELPACTIAELGYDTDGKRRRGARS